MENSTANQTLSNNTKTIFDNTTKPTAFFDPAWQILITIEFYFKYAVIAIGVFGMAANALVLYALVAHNAREAKKRVINLLVINQNILDLTSCILLIITYSVGNNMYLTGALGHFLCTIIISEAAAYCSLYASVINLITLTIERYLKVVHPFWSKKHLKRWMIYAAMVFAWIAGILTTLPPVIVSSKVEDGFCHEYKVWPNPTSRIAILYFVLFLYFVVPLVVFVYGYGHIVVVMRRQMRVMAGHKAEGSAQMNASQIQSKRLKWNIIKTMLIVSVAFIICWFPNNIFFIIVDNTTQTSNLFIGYYPTMFLAYLYICINPFIYAAKHDGVKQRLARLMIIHRCRGLMAVGDNSGSSSNNARGMQQTPAGTAHQ